MLKKLIVRTPKGDFDVHHCKQYADEIVIERLSGDLVFKSSEIELVEIDVPKTSELDYEAYKLKKELVELYEYHMSDYCTSNDHWEVFSDKLQTIINNYYDKRVSHDGLIR